MLLIWRKGRSRGRENETFFDLGLMRVGDLTEEVQPRIGGRRVLVTEDERLALGFELEDDAGHVVDVILADLELVDEAGDGVQQRHALVGLRRPVHVRGLLVEPVEVGVVLEDHKPAALPGHVDNAELEQIPGLAPAREEDGGAGERARDAVLEDAERPDARGFGLPLQPVLVGVFRQGAQLRHRLQCGPPLGALLRAGGLELHGAVVGHQLDVLAVVPAALAHLGEPPLHDNDRGGRGDAGGREFAEEEEVVLEEARALLQDPHRSGLPQRALLEDGRLSRPGRVHGHCTHDVVLGGGLVSEAQPGEGAVDVVDVVEGVELDGGGEGVHRQPVVALRVGLPARHQHVLEAVLHLVGLQVAQQPQQQRRLRVDVQPLLHGLLGPVELDHLVEHHRLPVVPLRAVGVDRHHPLGVVQRVVELPQAQVRRRTVPEQRQHRRLVEPRFGRCVERLFQRLDCSCVLSSEILACPQVNVGP